MKQLTWLLISLCIATSVNAQYVYTINADSVKITNHCDTAELILENHTQTIPGFLYNTGLGRTQFRRGLVQISATQYVIGADTLTLQGGVDTVGNIYSMVNLYHPATPKLVFVADTIDGGLFRYQATPAQVDSGKVFSAAAVGSGYWIRIIEQQAIANPWWYGLRPAVGMDTTGAHRNAIALNRCLRFNRNVSIPGGNYYIDSTIFVGKGASIGGTRSQGNGGASAMLGTALITTDTVTAMAYIDPNSTNASAYIHDFSLINAASGGTTNNGFFIGGLQFDVERVSVVGFGKFGFWVSDMLNGNYVSTTSMGTLSLCNASWNGSDGFHVGASDILAGIEFNNCYALHNQGTGFYLNGYDMMLISPTSSLNGKYAVDDEYGGNTILNPNVGWGQGDTIMLNGSSGILKGGVAINYVLSGRGLSNMDVSQGNYHGTAQIWRQTDWTGLNYDQDSTFAWVNASPGTIWAGAFVNGTPNGGAIGLDGLGGLVTCNQVLINRGWTVPGPETIYGKLWLQNLGVSGSGVWSDNVSVMLGGYVPYSPTAVTSFSASSGGPFGAASYYGIQGLGPSQGNEPGVTAVIYPRRSGSVHQEQTGLALTTALDSAGLQLRLNSHNFFEWVDTLQGQVNFATYGTIQGETQPAPNQPKGGNFNFENQDGSSNLYLNTYNHSSYSPYFKTGPTPAATATDSLVVWEPVDSGFRKIAPSQLVVNRGHTIFTPASGGSVTLVDNQINIINPSSGSITSLSVSFPASAANNDMIIVKFVQGVTTLSWTGADTPSTTGAGGYYVFTYDSASGSWY